ncbi:MAG: ECF transporter S component [Clostridiales Family XIII bacterium]|jgi:riboflavin transporter FmnP|nr:ECF transporter S component [Clostridiales Family XIII bacterium]
MQQQVRITEEQVKDPNSHQRTVKLAKAAMMLAISVVFSFIPSMPVLPTVDFIRYEFSDLPILISCFAFGVPAGIVIAALSIVINFFLGGAESGPYGMIMHIIAIGTYVLAAGLIYRVKKDRKHAIIGLIVGILAMTAVMIPSNLFITPAFMGVPVAVVKPLIVPAIIPVNLIKGLISAVLTFILYKRISPFLHK